MSKTGCSVPVLVARGELIHHFGIFHCLVDDLFQDFGFSWVQEKYTSHFIKCLCPYEDKTYEDETAFLEHLTLDHFFNLILGMVGAVTWHQTGDNVLTHALLRYCP